MRFIIGDGKVSNIIRTPNDIIFGHDKISIESRDSVRETLSYLRQGDVVINTAAKINLEWCEANQDEAFDVNTVGAFNLMRHCADKRAKFVQISSGCIFDGNDSWMDEHSAPTPSVWYTKTKTWADEMIQSHGYGNYLILRPRQLISAKEHRTNMLTKFASMKEIHAIDEQNSLTCLEDFKSMIEHLLMKNERGVFNCVNSLSLSPYDVAMAVKKKINPDLRVYRSSYVDFLKTLSVKRVNTLLDYGKLERTGYQNRTAQAALDWCLENYSNV